MTVRNDCAAPSYAQDILIVKSTNHFFPAFDAISQVPQCINTFSTASHNCTLTKMYSNRQPLFDERVLPCGLQNDCVCMRRDQVFPTKTVNQCRPPLA